MRLSKHAFFLAVLLLAAPFAASAAVPAWTPVGPFGAFVESITPDPVNPGVLYAATNQGLYKTGDAGGSWSLIYAGSLAGGHVAVDPLHPSTLYLTGAYLDAVVLKSVDGGAHWSPADAGLPRYYGVLAVDPARPRRLYFGTSGAGLWRSLDAGASWRQVGADALPSGAQGVITAVAASRPAGRVLVGTPRGLYRSNDGGDTWTLVNGLPEHLVDRVAFAPSGPRSAYAFVDQDGLYRSTDGGVSWRLVLKSRLDLAQDISISARDPRIVYLLLEGRPLYRSTNGGDRWAQIQTAGQVNAVAADPFSAATVYANFSSGPNLGGFWRSDDQGQSWTLKVQGLAGVSVGSLAIDRGDPDRLWAVVPGSPLRSTDGGARWTRLRTPPGESRIERVAAGAPSRLFAVTAKDSSDHSALPTYSLWRTDNDGSSWTRLPVPSLTLFQLRVAPSAPATLYAMDGAPVGVPSRFLRSTDSGAHWDSWPQTALSCGLGDLEAAPSLSTVVYLGGCKAPHVSAVLRSGDGGATFSDVSAGLPGTFVRALAVDPHDPNTLWAGTGNAGFEEPGDGVWKSTDGGAHWNRAGDELAGLTVSVLLAPDVPGRVYAAIADGRIFRSDDGGATWEDWTDSLPPTGIFSLQAAPDDPHRIYAVTSKGVWALNDAE